MKLFAELSQTARVMIKSLAAIFLALLAVGLLIILLVYPFERPFPYVVGLLLGTFTSVLKVALLEKSLNRSLDMEGKAAKNYGGLQAILRYFLTIIILLSAVFLPWLVGVFGVVLGILSLQLAAYITSFVLKKRPNLVDE